MEVASALNWVGPEPSQLSGSRHACRCAVFIHGWERFGASRENAGLTPWGLARISLGFQDQVSTPRMSGYGEASPVVCGFICFAALYYPHSHLNSNKTLIPMRPNYSEWSHDKDDETAFIETGMHKTGLFLYFYFRLLMNN